MRSMLVILRLLVHSASLAASSSLLLGSYGPKLGVNASICVFFVL